MPAPCAGWNAGRDPPRAEGFAIPVTVVAPVADQLRSGWQIRQQGRSPFVVILLPFGQEQAHRPPPTIANRVQFRVQPAFCPPDSAGNIPP